MDLIWLLPIGLVWLLSLLGLGCAADEAGRAEKEREMWFDAVAHGVAEVILNKDGKPTFRWRTFNESDVR